MAIRLFGELLLKLAGRLNGIGAWMKRHSRSIYGCTQAPAEFPCPQNCLLTFNPETKRLYVHVLSCPDLFGRPAGAYRGGWRVAGIAGGAIWLSRH